jgi:hypothetical protein
MQVTAKPKLNNPRHPERTQLYQTVSEHNATRLEMACSGQFALGAAAWSMATILTARQQLPCPKTDKTGDFEPLRDVCQIGTRRAPHMHSKPWWLPRQVVAVAHRLPEAQLRALVGNDVSG